MRYIRTKDGIYDLEKSLFHQYNGIRVLTPYCKQYEENPSLCKTADTIEELICDDDILYLHDLYPDAVLVVEGKIKPFGYDTAIELKEWLGYKHYKPKFDLFTKDTEGNYIKRAKTNKKGELELLWVIKL